MFVSTNNIPMPRPIGTIFTKTFRTYRKADVAIAGQDVEDEKIYTLTYKVIGHEDDGFGHKREIVQFIKEETNV